MTFAPRSYVALVHHPVLEKGGRVVTTAVTNLDVHDIARASRTYGLAGYFVVTPIAAQRRLVEEIRGHWTTGAGREHNDKRTSALELVRIVSSIEEARDAIAAERGHPPYVVATGARARADVAVVDHRVLRAAREADPRAVLLLFGTGWGLADPVFALADRVLAPIRGPATDGYNHLSVRSAVAIVLDRLFAGTE
jgi:hypothetical protein